MIKQKVHALSNMGWYFFNQPQLNPLSVVGFRKAYSLITNAAHVRPASWNVIIPRDPRNAVTVFREPAPSRGEDTPMNMRFPLSLFNAVMDAEPHQIIMHPIVSIDLTIEAELSRIGAGLISCKISVNEKFWPEWIKWEAPTTKEQLTKHLVGSH